MDPAVATAIASIGDIANNLTIFSTLAIVIVSLVKGWFVTAGHHTEVVAGLTTQLVQQDTLYKAQLAEKAASEERAWASAERAQKALADNNVVIDRAVDTVQALSQNLTRLPTTGGRS